jgi:hypothetical protein
MRDAIEEVQRSLKSGVNRAAGQGVLPQLILADPGLGLGKRREDNYKLLIGIERFRDLGTPMVVHLPPQEKSFNASAAEDIAYSGSLVTTGIIHGVHIVGVADLEGLAASVALGDAIKQVRRESRRDAEKDRAAASTMRLNALRDRDKPWRPPLLRDREEKKEPEGDAVAPEKPDRRPSPPSGEQPSGDRPLRKPILKKD